MYIIAITILSFLLVINYLIKKDIGYPPFLFCLIWTIILLGYFIISESGVLIIYKLSNSVLLFYVLGALSFSIGGVIAISFSKKRLNNNCKRPDYYLKSKFFDQLLFWIPVIAFPLFVYKMYKIASTPGMSNLFQGLRYQVSVNTVDIGYLQYILPFTFVNLITRFLLFKNRNSKKSDKFKYYFSLILTILYCFATTGRTYFFFLITIFIGYSIVNRTFKVKFFLWILPLVFIIFYIYAVLLNKGGSTSNSISENLNGTINSLYSYLFGGLKAFDQTLNNPSFYFHNGAFLYRFPQKIFFDLGIITNKPIQLVQDYANVPFPTNVYTIYYSYYYDYGTIYTFIMIIILGAFQTLLFIKMRFTKQILFIFLYIVFLYPLFISFFQDQYISLLSTWLQFLILFYFISKWLKPIAQLIGG